MKYRFVGDVHGKFKSYISRVEDCSHSIQVGDFGIGFPEDETSQGYDEMIAAWQLQNPGHRFIRGNHDDPAKAKTMPGYIQDGYYDSELDIFFMGGAASKDRATRKTGIDWWPEEELNYSELNNIVDLYEQVKPGVVVTHDCPVSVINPLFKHIHFEDTRTRMALDSMFEIHRPRLWIFGHYHTFRREILNGCEFICLPELKTIDLDL
jgi:hypothetical protein